MQHLQALTVDRLSHKDSAAVWDAVGTGDDITLIPSVFSQASSNSQYCEETEYY